MEVASSRLRVTTMRFRAELHCFVWLSVIGLSVPTGCNESHDPDPDDGGSAAHGGKGGAGGKRGTAGKGGAGGTGGSTETCGKAGTGGTGGSCSSASTGGVGGRRGVAGNGPWPSGSEVINATCGEPPEPGWGFELYEDANRIPMPKQGSKGIDVMGTVTDVGQGVPDDLGRIGNDEADLRHVRIQASDHTYTIVTYGVPGAGATLAMGTPVSLTQHNVETCDYVVCSSKNVFTTLRSDGSDTMLYAPTGEATPEGYTTSFGEELCEGRNHCTSWTGHVLEVTSPSGVTLELTPGDVDELGDFTIYAGSVTRFKEKNNLESARFQCADAIGRYAREILFVRTFGTL